MRVVILSDAFWPYTSGVGTYTIELARILLKLNHQVLILAADYPKDDSHPNGLEKAKVVRLRSTQTLVPNFRICLPNTAKVIKEIRDFKADIIEIEDPLFLGIDGLVASKILGIPNVSVFHTLGTSKEYLELAFKTRNQILKKASEFFHQKFYDSSDKVFVFTKDLSDYLAELGIRRHRLEIVSTLFDFYNAKLLKESEKKVLKKYYGLKRKVAVYLGRLSPEKNLETLIKIWGETIKEAPYSSLLIIGSGVSEQNLKNMVKKDNLEKNVNFVGNIEHTQLLKSGLLSICDVFVSTSKSEVFILTGLEAMAHRLPLILFKNRGIAEVVSDAGILVNQDDSTGFKNAILKIFKNPQLGKLMGKKARKIASNYNSEIVVKDVVKRYKKVINNYKPPRASLKNLKRIVESDKTINNYKKILKSIQKNLKIDKN